MIPKFNHQNEYFETYNSYVIQAKNRDKLRSLNKKKNRGIHSYWKRSSFRKKSFTIKGYILPVTERIEKKFSLYPYIPS